ncbi:hypothetical protein OCOL_001477 [Ordospora colligata]|uniref:Uncharacterized protein n=1 Tax=Ordospora colligata OC4 TaxID=1354746 RepID=A0A0B2UM65_9MICR|nr:uncharacterized protein M896_021890 [Ordospora colligata OC4]KHN70349.1 hypothetical protein M896_021890 [Ordospora colligata OC4]
MKCGSMIAKVLATCVCASKVYADIRRECGSSENEMLIDQFQQNPVVQTTNQESVIDGNQGLCDISEPNNIIVEVDPKDNSVIFKERKVEKGEGPEEYYYIELWEKFYLTKEEYESIVKKQNKGAIEQAEQENVSIAEEQDEQENVSIAEEQDEGYATEEESEQETE